MTVTVPERGRLTDAVVAYLAAHSAVGSFPLVVGDGDPPASAGWPSGNAEVGAFVASTTVRTGPAVPLNKETVRSRHTSWKCRYGVRTIGAVRQQADAAADVVRQALVAMPDTRVTMAVDDYVVQAVVFESFGGVEKQGSTDLATWQVDDVVELWIVRATT